MKLVIHPTATADLARIPAAHIVVSLRADGMYELSVNVDPEIEVSKTIDPEIEVAIDPEVEVAIDPEVEVDVDDQYEYWYEDEDDWEVVDVEVAVAQAAQRQGKPWTCPRCESTNDAGLTICEICDEQI